MKNPAESPRVAIVVLTYRQTQATLGLLDSLQRTSGPVFRILVRDNGSGDDTVERLRNRYPDVHVQAGEANLGAAGGRNVAARRAIELWDPEYLLFLDNDMKVEPSFVAELLRPLDEDASLGQTQGKLLQMADPGRLDDGGGVRIVWWRGLTGRVGFGEPDRGQYDQEKACQACGGATMVRASIFCELGGFDESFDPYGYEDIDFSLRVRAAGHRNLYVPTAVAQHAGQHTFGAGYTPDYARKKVQSWFRFLRRHGTLGQRFAFYFVGGPLSALGMAWREIRRGNLGAVKGAVREAFRSIRPG